jgi:hypothetical protein
MGGWRKRRSRWGGMLGGADGGVSGWKQRGWGKQKGRPPLKEEKARRQGVGGGFRQWRQRGDRRFRNEDDEEKRKLMWLLCMHREFI